MGFVPLEHEYKLMGMAAYAAPEPAATSCARRSRAADLRRGAPALSAAHAAGRRSRCSGHLLELIRGERFDAVCAALQRFTEDLLVRLVRAAIHRTGIRQRARAGGVFMNVKANQRIAELPEVESASRCSPRCGDETLRDRRLLSGHAGSASDARRRHRAARDFYLGDDVTEAAAAKRSSGCGSRETPCRRTSSARSQDCSPPARSWRAAQGRMEFGARALGNRSILADPAESGRRSA